MPKPGESKFIPADWKRWIAENLLKNADRRDLQRILVENGFSSDLARMEIDTAEAHPYVSAGASIARQLSKRDWVLHTMRRLRLTGQANPIDVRSSISGEEFLHLYYRMNRPLLLSGFVSHWRAVSLWRADYLCDRCGNLTVEIQGNRDGNPRYELEPHAHRRTMLFEDLVRFCFREEESNDIYMTARNGHMNSSILDSLWGDIEMLPEILNPCGARSGLFLWIGPRGTVTPLHHDLTNNLMIQVVGQKRIRLIAPDNLPFLYNSYHVYSSIDPVVPDVSKYPLYANSDVIEVTLNPGDTFFLPIGWWHHVVSLSTSITITCTNFQWPNDFTEFYSTYGDI
jgi:hypothetical protein